MFLDQFEARLFRPLSSPNAKVYGVGLWALYKRLVLNQLDLDECTPKDARDIIRLALIENSQHVDWEQEGEEGLSLLLEDGDDAGRVYRYLRDCGWLREIDDIGYRRVTYFPQIASQLLSALDTIKHGRSAKLGATCQGVYSALMQAKEKPTENASQIEFAANAARSFYSDLSAMSGSCREIAHRMSEAQGGNQLFHTFFKDFLKGILLGDYSTLKTTNHPYRYRVVTLTLAVEILSSESLMCSLIETISRENNDPDRDRIGESIARDLNDINSVFENIDALLQRIEHYRSSMTRRAREAMQYALTAVPDLGVRIEGLVGVISKITGDECLPAFLSEDTYLAPDRLYTPRTKQPEPEPTEIMRLSPPIKAIAHSRAMDQYLRRRQDNPKRIEAYLEQAMQSCNVITTDDLRVESLDDFLAYLQLRDLLHDAVASNSVFQELLQSYRLTPVKGETTENDFLSAPKLRIERRNSPKTRSKPYVA